MKLSLTDRVRTNSQVTLLLDCNGICHALRHTIGGLNYQGRETGIIFGFLLQLFALQKRFRPYRWVFAWDSRHSLRRKLYPQYKGNRVIQQNPEEEWSRQSAFQQFDLLREKILPTLNLNTWNFHQQGYEADDLIAAAMEQFDGKKIIISQDHDLYQLLAWDISIYKSNTRTLFTEEDFRKQYGISPQEWVYVKAIAGCPGDNVEGVHFVGEKKAIKYLRGELSSKSSTYASILLAKDVIARNRRLVGLPFDGCCALVKDCIRGLSSSVPSRPSEEGFWIICQEYGFDSFLESEKYTEWQHVFGWSPF